MRRIVKIFVIIAIIIVVFLAVAYFVPGVKSTVDNALGPAVTGFGASIIASIEPLYTIWLAPWPNHAIFWGLIGLGFMYTLLWSWDMIRLKAKQSIDSKAGVYGTKTQPIVTHTDPKPKPTTDEPEPPTEEKT